MVLNTLYLMVPLLKHYLGFPWSSIPTKCVNSCGPQPLSSYRCAEEVANILLCSKRACGLWWWLTGSQSPPPWRFISSSSKSASTPPAGTLQQPKGGLMWDVVNSLCAAFYQRSSINFLNCHSHCLEWYHVPLRQSWWMSWTSWGGKEQENQCTQGEGRG